MPRDSFGSQSPLPYDLLKCTRLPARLPAEGAAVLLGFKPHDIPVLVGARLIKPLGKPSQGAPKWFASKDILEVCDDLARLARATDVVSARWRKRNGRALKSSSRGAKLSEI